MANVTQSNVIEKKAEVPAAEAGVRWAVPPVDVYENDREFLVMMDVPGVTADSVKLRFDRGELHFEAENALGAGVVPEGARLGSVRYRRAFQLPDFIDAAQLSAELRDGVLAVHLPKLDAVRPRHIPVRSA